MAFYAAPQAYEGNPVPAYPLWVVCTGRQDRETLGVSMCGKCGLFSPLKPGPLCNKREPL